jgi:DNA repair exonuclease SbcCD ATPase subunit
MAAVGDAIVSAIDELDKKMDDVQSSLNNLDLDDIEKAKDLSRKLEDLDTKVDDISNAIDDVDFDDIATKVDDISNAIDNVDFDDIATGIAKIEDLESKVENLDPDQIESMKSDMEELESKVNGFDSAFENIPENIGDDVNELESRVADVEEKLTAVNRLDLDFLEEAHEAHNGLSTAVDKLNLAGSAYESRLAVIEAKLGIGPAVVVDLKEITPEVSLSSLFEQLSLITGEIGKRFAKNEDASLRLA